jgi:hypothetical protein
MVTPTGSSWNSILARLSPIEAGNAQVVGGRFDNATMKPVPEELLGEYRINEAAKEIELLGAVRLKKGNRDVVTIQIAEIVRFKQ